MPDNDLIPFGKLPQHIKGRPNLSTLHRWRMRGIAGVKLQVIYRGGRVFGTKALLEEFFERVTAAKQGEAPPQRTARQRRLAVASAAKRLAKAGW